MAMEPENIECSLCGASLRPGAAFCHKCGAKFAAVEQPAAVSSAWFRGDITAPDPIPDPEPELAPEPEAAFEPAKTNALGPLEAPFETAPEPEFLATVSDSEARVAAADTQNLVDPAAEILPIGKKMPPREVEAPPPTTEVPASVAAVEAETIIEEETPPAPPPVRAKPMRPVTEAAKPAAPETIRRKPKEKVEVAWEAPDSGLNIVFIIGSIVIFVLVLLIVMGVFFVR